MPCYSPVSGFHKCLYMSVFKGFVYSALCHVHVYVYIDLQANGAYSVLFVCGVL